MDIVLIILRLIHIFSGVFWVGATLVVTGFLQPAAAAAGPEGGKFMQRLFYQTRFGPAQGIAGALTILSGLAMYLRDSGGLQLAWITSGSGLVLTIGGLAGILAGVVGIVAGAPAGSRLAALTQQIQTSGAPPMAAQIAEIQPLQKRINQVTMWTTLLLIIALAAMATARYF
jgi:uncharacterized membrane protein